MKSYGGGNSTKGWWISSKASASGDNLPELEGFFNICSLAILKSFQRTAIYNFLNISNTLCKCWWFGKFSSMKDLN